MLGIQEVAPSLYAHYLLTLQEIDPATLLDVGCGGGGFIKSIIGNFPDAKMKGIDLSPSMVSRAKENGVDSECIDLCDLDEKYDVITATFDVLNYLDGSSLSRFAKCVQSTLCDDGYFLCDINTEHGLEDVAVGSFIADWDDRFLAIDSDYDSGVYTSTFTLFERDKECFTKSSENINQYLHTIQNIADALGMELLSSTDVMLYSDEPDKSFLVFRNKVI